MKTIEENKTIFAGKNDTGLKLDVKTSVYIGNCKYEIMYICVFCT